MVLTNMLPDQGNGTYQLFAYAHDREGRVAQIGSRTIACDNDHAVKPFGTIDTPTQGGIASGTSYINFGWALTPQPKMIPSDGSTITVLVDGVSKGTASYGYNRSDIAGFFPGYANSSGAVGFKMIDTSTLSEGLHTISWVVTDNQGVTEGIGSRFFTVRNTSAPLMTLSAGEVHGDSLASVSAARAAPGRSPELAARAPREPSQSMLGRRGWDLTSPLETFDADPSGTVIVRSEEVNRIELHLGFGSYAGYLVRTEGLAPLPPGATLDDQTGVFSWAPGVGFVGTYDLAFVRWDGAQPVGRVDVRVTLSPKGLGLVGAQVVIDTPIWQQDVAQPFVLAGWAIDPDVTHGSGIATLHAWAYPLTGGAPIFLGAMSYGGSRPDVAAIYGDQFKNAGFGLHVQGLVHGHYDIAVFAWSTKLESFIPARVVRVTVR
jgi:hypothetical protein